LDVNHKVIIKPVSPRKHSKVSSELINQTLSFENDEIGT